MSEPKITKFSIFDSIKNIFVKLKSTKKDQIANDPFEEVIVTVSNDPYVDLHDPYAE